MLRPSIAAIAWFGAKAWAASPTHDGPSGEVVVHISAGEHKLWAISCLAPVAQVTASTEYNEGSSVLGAPFHTLRPARSCTNLTCKLYSVTISHVTRLHRMVGLVRLAHLDPDSPTLIPDPSRGAASFIRTAIFRSLRVFYSIQKTSSAHPQVPPRQPRTESLNARARFSFPRTKTILLTSYILVGPASY